MLREVFSLALITGILFLGFYGIVSLVNLLMNFSVI
jgi:hypothetical protein